MPEHDVLCDGEDGDEHEVLVHHADPGAHRVAGALEVLHVIVEEDHALVGGVQAVEDIHERRLARAVLAQQAVDLSRLDDEIDAVVGDEGAEPLGDPAEFELHGADPSDGGCAGAPEAVGRAAHGASPRERLGKAVGRPGEPDLPTGASLSPRGTTRP